MSFFRCALWAARLSADCWLRRCSEVRLRPASASSWVGVLVRAGRRLARVTVMALMSVVRRFFAMRLLLSPGRRLVNDPLLTPGVR